MIYIYIYKCAVYVQTVNKQNNSEKVSEKLKSVLTVHHLNAENPASFSERRRGKHQYGVHIRL